MKFLGKTHHTVLNPGNFGALWVNPTETKKVNRSLNCPQTLTVSQESSETLGQSCR